MSAEEVGFPGKAGATVHGRLELPLDERPVAFALFAHCFACSADLTPAVQISRALCREGIAVLRIDVTGLGEGGRASPGDAVPWPTDYLVSAAEWLASQREAPTILVGHSLGGAAVLRAAERIPSVAAVVTIAAPAGREPMERLLTGEGEPDEAEVEINGRRFGIRKAFLEELGEQETERAARELRRPLLILHSPLDQAVGIDNAATIFKAARHPKSFVSLDRADHLLSDTRDSRYAGALIAAWASRFVTATSAQSVEQLVAERGVTTRTGESGYRTEVRMRGHSLVADEPLAVGGEDTGPTPYELLAAALGTCTSMTLRMYAERKGWPLEETTVRLEHSRVHALDEEQCEHREPRVDEIRRTVEVVGRLSAEQRARLLEIADRCPVHRTLEAGVRIRTRAVEPPEAADAAG